MKKIFFIIFITFTSVFSFASSSDIQEVVETGINKKDMWINLKKWCSSEFNSYDHVVDLEDEESGTLIVKWKNGAYLNISKCIKTIVSSTIKVEVKENKYRYTVSDAQIKIEPNTSNKSEMSIRELENGIADLEFIISFCTEYYNNSTKINIDEKFNNIINDYRKKVESTKKYKNEKKTKISKEWVKINKEYEILNEMLYNYNCINTFIIDSLKKKIIEKDEW